MALSKVAIIGANGHLGPVILSALLSAPSLTVTVLTRASSTSTYPESARTIVVPDSLPFDEVKDALSGQDALIMTFMGTLVAEQIKLADAAHAAGVRRIIPADFGSCDSADEYTLELLPIMAGKAKVRGHLEQLVKRGGEGSFSWTSLITGHFFDHGLHDGLLLFDLPKRCARILDGGDIKWSATTLEKIGEAVVRILEKEEKTRNKILYIQSFSTSQNEVLKVLEKVMGRSWEVEHVSAANLVEQNKDGAANGDRDAVMEVVSVHGLVASYWKDYSGFSNGLLGLEEEELELAIRKALVPSK